MTDLFYPKELQDGNLQYPFIQFSALDKKNNVLQNINLYMPQTIQFGDSMAYNEYERNRFGVDTAIENAINDTKASGGGIGDFMTSFAAQKGEGISSWWNSTDTASQIAAGLDTAQRTGIMGLFHLDKLGEKGRDAFLFATGTAVNPNIHTRFTSPNMRSFSFTFKMFTVSEADSINRKNIIETLINYQYPEKADGINIIFKYPNKFRIKFFNTPSEENKYIRKIYDCYLTSVSTVYNTSSSMLHEDGSPVDIELTLNFQEAKILSREDIQELEVEKTLGLPELSAEDEAIYKDINRINYAAARERLF